MKCDYNSDQLASLVEKQISIYWDFEGGGVLNVLYRKH